MHEAIIMGPGLLSGIYSFVRKWPSNTTSSCINYLISKIQIQNSKSMQHNSRKMQKKNIGSP